MRREHSSAVLLVICIVVLILGVGTVVAFEVSPTHEHRTHKYGVEDVEYDEQHDIVWSIDSNASASSVQFIGYDVEAQEVSVSKVFDQGHALTVGDGAVYIAAGNILWEYNVSNDSTTLLLEMEHHPGDMDYDETRDLIWASQSGDVVAYDAENGSEVMRHSNHSEGGTIVSLSVQGRYIASVLTWEPEVIVYDIKNEEVSFEPLPDDIDPEEDNLVSVHVTESAELIIGGGWDTVYMYDIENRSLMTQYAAHAFGATEVRYHEAADVIVSAGTGNHIAFYDVDTSAVVSTYEHVATIETADLDMANDIVWFGDNGQEQAGTVTGLQIRDLGPSPVGGDIAPTDPDGDGKYEDVNGDGEFTIVDVQILFVERNSGTVKADGPYYDFTGDGDFSVSDVQQLFVNFQSR